MKSVDGLLSTKNKRVGSAFAVDGFGVELSLERGEEMYAIEFVFLKYHSWSKLSGLRWGYGEQELSYQRTEPSYLLHLHKNKYLRKGLIGSFVCDCSVTVMSFYCV